MMVQAKCIMPASLSSPVQCLFMPGQGPLPGGLYEIDRDGPLAKLKTNGGKTGKYVFEFDRNAGPDDKPHDYSCKKDGCGKHFKTLAGLGTHTKLEHKEESVTASESEDEPEVEFAKDGRGRKKGRTFTCKHPGCGQVLPHLYGLKVHNRTHAPLVPSDDKDTVAQAV